MTEANAKPADDFIEMAPTEPAYRTNIERDDDEVSVQPEARGDELPEGYFLSLQFIGMAAVRYTE